ncbi:NAD(P)/FAD-dependent oxidoreductase [Actinocatenispora rupis]|uniref:Pyridine nucleotide-disulfide oxidoreductase n=1 Tax=Actinocatenispora rupis TaxID=519421 RepID=A0A8J3JIF2_9ACTN|nr:NAD(P)/FAD-dependent oxidoreductase [Actinocatenispora rupis]GID15558.1 pyridine nucleotide-disulfide oxidoreductase [Actinocatenispora rupis]
MHDVAVVGAGPAGLAAVDVLASHGARVLVVDEQPRAGGQIHRQPPATFAAATVPAGRALLAVAERADVDWWWRTAGWGVFGGHAGLDDFAGSTPADRADGDGPMRLAVHGPDGARTVRPRAVLLTAGAYDLPVPFPGWTLPGVLTAGGVQVFVKSAHLLPGRRFVLAGAHPLLLVVAAQLVAAGAEVAEVLLVRRPRAGALLRMLPAAAGNTGKLREGGHALAVLRRAGVPVRFGTRVVRADAGPDGELAAVVLAAPDGTHRTVPADVLALGYGFVPSTDLARQAGCAVRYDPAAGGWVVTHDRWQRSSVPRVSVAGEITGVAGAEQAVAEGRLAALGLLADLGLVPAPRIGRLARPVRRDLRRRRRFATALAAAFPPPAPAPADDETVLCRCEEVTAGTVRAALRANPHLRTANGVKLLTRTGMGLCQGRSCQPAVCALIAAETGRSVAEVGPYTARPPIRPIPLGTLAGGDP